MKFTRMDASGLVLLDVTLWEGCFRPPKVTSYAVEAFAARWVMEHVFHLLLEILAQRAEFRRSSLHSFRFSSS